MIRPTPRPIPSNQDSNKGILNNQYKPYPPLVKAMELLNEKVYGLMDYFARQNR